MNNREKQNDLGGHARALTELYIEGKASAERVVEALVVRYEYLYDDELSGGEWSMEGSSADDYCEPPDKG